MVVIIIVVVAPVVMVVASLVATRVVAVVALGRFPVRCWRVLLVVRSVVPMDLILLRCW